MFAKLIRPKSDMRWPEGKVFSQTKICFTRSRLHRKMAKIHLSRIESSAFQISSYAGPSVLDLFQFIVNKELNMLNSHTCLFDAKLFPAARS